MHPTTWFSIAIKAFHYNKDYNSSARSLTITSRYKSLPLQKGLQLRRGQPHQSLCYKSLPLQKGLQLRSFYGKWQFRYKSLPLQKGLQHEWDAEKKELSYKSLPLQKGLQLEVGSHILT